MAAGDSMGKLLKDNVEMKLDCGHPNIDITKEKCPLCGAGPKVIDLTVESETSLESTEAEKDPKVSERRQF